METNKEIKMNVQMEKSESDHVKENKSIMVLPKEYQAQGGALDLG